MNDLMLKESGGEFLLYQAEDGRIRIETTGGMGVRPTQLTDMRRGKSAVDSCFIFFAGLALSPE